MMLYLYEKNIILYTYAILCGMGLLFRFIVNIVYKHLVKESDNPGETKNKMLKHIKMKFETCYKLKIGVNNVDTFVDKHLLKYRLCGFLLSTWDNICGQILFLNLLMVPVLSVFGVVYKCGQNKLLLSGAVGILSSAVLILVDKSMNVSGKKRILRLNLLDYLENFCKVRLEQEVAQPELIEQYRREYIQTTEVKKQISATTTTDPSKEEMKDELNRRREARLKKEEERKLLASKKEEEQRKAEEARKEEEKRKNEERRQLAARRREEERMKIEEEREALEARSAEIRRKNLEKQQANERKLRKDEEKEQIIGSLEEELKTVEEKTDMEAILKGLEEIAAEKDKSEIEKEGQAKPHKGVNGKSKTQGMSIQEDKLIEDVLKEFFA